MKMVWGESFATVLESVLAKEIPPELRNVGPSVSDQGISPAWTVDFVAQRVALLLQKNWGIWTGGASVDIPL